MKELYRTFDFSGYEVLDVKIWKDQLKVPELQVRNYRKSITCTFLR